MNEIVLPGRAKPRRVRCRKLVSFSEPNTTKNITQDDLIKERIAYQKALRAYEDWQEKHHSIQNAIEHGANVDEGIWKAEVVERLCESPISGLPLKIVKLVVW